MSDLPRPKHHLLAAGLLYPGAWRQIDDFRAAKGVDLPDWPDWCFVPIGATQAIVATDAGIDGNLLGTMYPERIEDAARLAALAAWRMTQGIYRFDPALYSSVIDTPMDRDLPCDVFYRLPEWCVYIETPDLSWLNSSLYGFWAHLEFDVNTGCHELRFVMDSDAALTPVVIHLGSWPLLEAIERARQEAVRRTLMVGLSRIAGAMSDASLAQDLERVLAPMVSLLLYVCSQSAEVGSSDRRPGYPAPKKTKKGWRLFPANHPVTWDVGVRIGAALRKAYQDKELGQGSVDPETGRARPRAHVRRAHWHGFWKGPKDPERSGERKFDIKWMPPIPVNVDDVTDLPATIKPLK
ncbi:MAG: hypothetical protein LAT63_17420 [Marinobacter sp.]|nr:hypothetical protein [Marinobacter sp.]